MLFIFIKSLRGQFVFPASHVHVHFIYYLRRLRCRLKFRESFSGRDCYHRASRVEMRWTRRSGGGEKSYKTLFTQLRAMCMGKVKPDGAMRSRGSSTTDEHHPPLHPSALVLYFFCASRSQGAFSFILFALSSKQFIIFCLVIWLSESFLSASPKKTELER